MFLKHKGETNITCVSSRQLIDTDSDIQVLFLFVFFTWFFSSTSSWTGWCFFLPTKESFISTLVTQTQLRRGTKQKHLPIQETPAMPVRNQQRQKNRMNSSDVDFVCTQYIIVKFETPGKTFFLFNHFRASLSHAIEHHMFQRRLLWPCRVWPLPSWW